MNNKALWLTLLGLLLAAAVLNILWLSTHVAPVAAGKDAALVAIEQVHRFEKDPGAEIYTLLRMGMRTTESWYNLSAAKTLFLFGKSYLSMVAISTLYYLALIAFTFGAAFFLGGPRAAVWAGALVALTPAAFSWSRLFSPNIALMAFSATGLFCLAASRWWTRFAPAVGFAAVAALSIRMGETVGDNFQLWVVFGIAVTYVLIVRFAVLRESWRRALLVTLAAALVFVLLTNWNDVNHRFGYLWAEGVDLADSAYGAGSPSSLGAWTTYPLLLWKMHLLPPLTLALIGAVAFLAWRRDLSAGLPWVVFIGGLLLITLVHKKNYNYLFGFLPLAPLIIAYALAKIENSRLQFALGGALIGVCLVVFGYLSFVDVETTVPYGDLKSGTRAARADHIGHLIFYPKKQREHAPTNIVRQAVQRAQTDPKQTLWIIGDLADTEAHTFRLPLALANWNGALRVVDVGREFSDIAFYHRASGSEPPPPNTIICLPSMQRFFVPGGVCDSTAIFARLNADYLAGAELTEQRLYDEAAESWCRRLEQIPWETFRRREFEYLSTVPGRDLERFVVYDQPRSD
ncbi:MAG: hypothetical protein P9L99_20425 [Candidatus Lernaella stagnicola]|nr:hypothetical protein [Candidatus Lernaella stagnicola]